MGRLVLQLPYDRYKKFYGPNPGNDRFLAGAKFFSGSPNYSPEDPTLANIRGSWLGALMYGIASLITDDPVKLNAASGMGAGVGNIAAPSARAHVARQTPTISQPTPSHPSVSTTLKSLENTANSSGGGGSGGAGGSGSGGGPLITRWFASPNPRPAAPGDPALAAARNALPLGANKGAAGTAAHIAKGYPARGADRLLDRGIGVSEFKTTTQPRFSITVLRQQVLQAAGYMPPGGRVVVGENLLITAGQYFNGAIEWLGRAMIRSGHASQWP